MKNETRIPFFLMFKHLFRGNKWTLGLIIFLISIAFINLVFVSSLFEGIIDLTNSQIINTYSGNLSMTPLDGEEYIQNSLDVLEKIENTDNVESASSHVLLTGKLEFDGTQGIWGIVVINPEMEKEVTTVNENMFEGDYLESDDADGIIIGRQISGGDNIEMDSFSLKGIKVGDKINLTIGEVSKELFVRGIFHTKFLETDSRAFITQPCFEQIMPSWDMDQSSEIIIKSKEEEKEKIIMEDLQSQGFSENFYTWEDVSGLMKSVTSSFLSINALLTVVGVIITAVTIFIVIYIDITDKQQQIGILRAIGIKSYLINSMYVLQAAVYSVLGVVIGLLLFFFIIIPYFKTHPFVLPLGDAVLSVNYIDLWFRAELVMVTSVLSALIPSVHVTRKSILSCIWGK